MKYQVNVLHKSGWDTIYFPNLKKAASYCKKSIKDFPDKVHTIELIKTVFIYIGQKQ